MGGRECAKTIESVGDSAGTVFHVDNDEVIAGEARDLGEGGGEAEEEETVEDFATVETGLEGLVGIDRGNRD